MRSQSICSHFNCSSNAGQAALFCLGDEPSVGSSGSHLPRKGERCRGKDRGRKEGEKEGSGQGGEKEKEKEREGGRGKERKEQKGKGKKKWPNQLSSLVGKCRALLAFG